MEKLTYKDFKIGQKVICVKRDDFYEKHLTVGKTYIVENTDFYVFNSICVRSDNNKTSMFFNIEYFSDIKTIRKLKLEKLKK